VSATRALGENRALEGVASLWVEAKRVIGFMVWSQVGFDGNGWMAKD
jgi:hypothetical protein